MSRHNVRRDGYQPSSAPANPRPPRGGSGTTTLPASEKCPFRIVLGENTGVMARTWLIQVGEFERHDGELDPKARYRLVLERI